MRVSVTPDLLDDEQCDNENLFRELAAKNEMTFVVLRCEADRPSTKSSVYCTTVVQ